MRFIRVLNWGLQIGYAEYYGYHIFMQIGPLVILMLPLREED